MILPFPLVGFDYTAVMARNGGQRSFGLINLRERGRLLVGTVDIQTAPGKGTRLIFNIPYAEPNHGPNR